MPSLLEEQEDIPPPQNVSKAPTAATADGGPPYTTLPNGVVVDKNGKPCRTCTSSAAWKNMMRSAKMPGLATSKAQTQSQSLTQSKPQQQQQQHQSQSTTTTAQASNRHVDSEDPQCPPDVEELGRSSWTLLHSLTASYPSQPTSQRQSQTRSFLNLFAQLYPCGYCAADFREWMSEDEEGRRLDEALRTQEGFGRWMCKAHNAVNGKVGKEEFDCERWRERWRDGWADGRCD